MVLGLKKFIFYEILCAIFKKIVIKIEFVISIAKAPTIGRMKYALGDGPNLSVIESMLARAL